MEIEESQWIRKAIENIDMYLNRGGDLKGDEPQLLGGTDLLNTIGVAMGFPVRDPEKWTEKELQYALNNELVYFDGDERKVIDYTAAQIKYCCDGNDINYVTVLPIELYWNGKLYELPLFRVHRHEKSRMYYVDNLGRYYKDVNDWYTNNYLLPCKMVYPCDLKLTLKPGSKNAHVLIDNTPRARFGSQIVKRVDLASIVAGAGSFGVLMLTPGMLVVPLLALGAVSTIWGTSRTGYDLLEGLFHGEEIYTFNNIKKRSLWIRLSIDEKKFGALGASTRITSAAPERKISSSFKILVNVINRTKDVVSGVAVVNSAKILIDHYKKLSHADFLLHVASIAFWTKGDFTYKTNGNLIRNIRDHAFKVIVRELKPTDAVKLSSVRNYFNDDSQLIQELYRASKFNISMETFSRVVIDIASIQRNIQFDGAGNLILKGGQKYAIEFLCRLPQKVRKDYFKVIANLRTDQIEQQLESFRQKLNNDIQLISALHTAVTHYQITSYEVIEQLLNFWGKYKDSNIPTNGDISIKPNQLRELLNSMIRFIHRSRAL